MYTITKEFSFAASHKLDHLPAEHPCHRTHGHNYIVVIELQASKLNVDKMVLDYRKLKPIKEYIDDHLDHQHLNDVMSIFPTAENIAKYIYDLFSMTYPQMISVTVKETPKTAAKYTPEFEEEA